MAVANGYGKTVTSGSVFMYDVGDTINSYRGEPTTNLINPNVVNIYSWWTRNVASIIQLSETYKGQPIYRVSISIDSGDMLYHITERWGAGSGWYMPYVTFNANTPYIASVIYRPISHPDTRIYGHPSNISGWGATVDGSIDIDSQWKMHRIDRNFGATVGDNRFYHMHTPSAQIGQTIVVDITNSQIEQNSHVTPFVNGTRSATQGLLPIVGNSTINLSNVSFDSNAQITFDGTDDFIPVSDTPFRFTNTFTLDAWVYFNGSDINGTIIGKRNGSPYNQYSISIYSGNPYLGGTGKVATFFGREDAGGGATDILLTYTLPSAGFYNIVASINTNSQTLYVNGVAKATTSINISSNTYNISGRDLLIGAARNNDNTGIIGPFTGTIPITKIYNRALSAAEVRQNYNKYKTRFNLP